MSETIYFNGKKYNSVAEMPSDIRQIYENINRFMVDQNRDGVPDIVQSGGLSGIKETVNMIMDISKISNSDDFKSGQMSMVRVTDESIFINGKEYSSVAEMPNHVRKEFERIVKDSQDGNEDIFDESWRSVGREDYFSPHDDEILNQPFGRKDQIINTPIETVDSTKRFILLATIAFLILGCMVAMWFLYI